MPTTIALLARKGGVGRSTITFCLAGAFAKAGGRILVIDLDGQASLSRTFFGNERIESIDPARTVVSVLSGFDPDPGDVIHETAFESVWLLPSCNRVEQFTNARVPGQGTETERAIAELIQDVASDFDVVLIDTSPNTNSQPTWTGLVATDYVISPVPCDAYGTQSIASVQAVVQDVAQINPHVVILGYVLNMIQRNSVNDTYAQIVKQLHTTQVFETVLPLSVAYREAVAARTPVTEYKPRSKAAKLVNQFAAEIDRRITSHQAKRAA